MINVCPIIYIYIYIYIIFFVGHYHGRLSLAWLKNSGPLARVKTCHGERGKKKIKNIIIASPKNTKYNITFISI